MRKPQIVNLQSQVRRMRVRSAQRCQQRIEELNEALPEQWRRGNSGPKVRGAMNRMAESPQKHMNGFPIRNAGEIN
jgi:hypothetical protein